MQPVARGADKDETDLILEASPVGLAVLRGLSGRACGGGRPCLMVLGWGLAEGPFVLQIGERVGVRRPMGCSHCVAAIGR